MNRFDSCNVKFQIKKMSNFSTMEKHGFSKLEYSVNIVVGVGVGGLK
jgi:hypothetical protein